MSLIFCTSNPDKLKFAKLACQKHGVELEQIDNQVDEVQSEDPIEIIKHKAKSVFDKINKPLLVSDDCWSIPALNGFPGPYMKSMNHWFTASDWLKIMKNYQDKTIYLTARLAYINKNGLITIFEETHERKFIDQASSRPGTPILQVTSFVDDKTPLNELLKKDLDKYCAGRKLWDDFLDWYKKI